MTNPHESATQALKVTFAEHGPSAWLLAAAPTLVLSGKGNMTASGFAAQVLRAGGLQRLESDGRRRLRARVCAGVQKCKTVADVGQFDARAAARHQLQCQQGEMAWCPHYHGGHDSSTGYQ